MKATLLLLACLACMAVSAQHQKINKGTYSIPGMSFAAVMQAKYDTTLAAYLNQAREEIAGNNKRITSLLAKLLNVKDAEGKNKERIVTRLVKSIEILQVYNQELRKELNEFIEFGEGDWRLFRREFNRDLAEINRDLAELRLMIYEEFVV